MDAPPAVYSADGLVRPERPAVDVVAGVLVLRNPAGDERGFLLTTRPPGKVWAGHWEFPGGKVEPGETLHAALARELHEELGIAIVSSHAWHDCVMDYEHARVRLHLRKVFEWRGAFEMREGQRMAWDALPALCRPLLPGALPALAWLAADWGHRGPTHL